MYLCGNLGGRVSWGRGLPGWKLRIWSGMFSCGSLPLWLGALAVEEGKVLLFACFLCCESQGCFPQWEESVCMVQSNLLPKFFVVWELLFPHASSSTEQGSCRPVSSSVLSWDSGRLWLLQSSCRSAGTAAQRWKPISDFSITA